MRLYSTGPCLLAELGAITGAVRNGPIADRRSKALHAGTAGPVSGGVRGLRLARTCALPLANRSWWPAVAEGVIKCLTVRHLITHCIGGSYRNRRPGIEILAARC